MDGEIHIFIADASASFAALLKRELEKLPGIVVDDGALNGIEAYRKLQQRQPDILVMDLLLPGLNGLELLRRLTNENRMPKRTIVVTSYLNDKLAQAFDRLGVMEYITKPCRVSELLQRICATPESDRERYEQYREKLIADALRKYGIPAHLSGYRYLISAVRRTMDDPNALRGITKILYPDLAREFSTTPQCIERSIRSAICKGWEAMPQERRQRYFGPVFSAIKEPLGNSHFIAAIVHFLQIDYEAVRWFQ